MSSGHTSSIHNRYTFDELESISKAPSQAAVTEELKGSPTRPRNTSHLYTHRSVDYSIRAELHRSRYNGISFEGSSKCSFEESDEDINALERPVEEKSVHNLNGFRFQSKESAKYAKLVDAKMYKLFADSEMANMVLDAYQEGSGNRTKTTHPSPGSEYVKGDSFVKRKLYVSLVPEKDGDEDYNPDTLQWYLCVLGFKKSQRRKHPREEEDSNLESRKRGSITTREPISTTITASVDGTASGIGQSARELGTATRASTGAKASDAGPSTRGRGTAVISSTGMSSQPTALRRWQRLATSSTQSDTLQLANCATMLSVFSERLLHRDISVANMLYYMKDERNAATLIDFDLATFPDKMPNLGEIEPPGTVGSVNGSASSATVVDTPVVSHAPGASASLFTEAIVGGKGNNGKCQNRIGTTPFMAVETLDLHFPGYVYHLCHDLESLFYAIVWHGVGYRRTEGIHPYTTDLARQKVDILRGWRVGPWSDVADRKDLFLAKAENILQYMKHTELQDICGDLSLLFQQRMIALRGRERARKVAARSAASAGAVKRQDVKRRAMNIVYNQPIFPSFADIWGFERVECRKNCCAN